MRNGLCAVLVLLGASALPGAPKKAVVCKTCHDKGSVPANCPVCRGTKYVWQCQGKSGKGWGQYEVLENGADGVKTTEGWCGYGATYKPIHQRCPNVRKRQGCPNCAKEGRKVGTGKVPSPCPDCDGHGHVRIVCYLVPNEESLSGDREQILRQLTAQTGDKLVERRKLTPAELEEYKSEHPHCRVFTKLMDLVRYCNTLDAPAPQVAETQSGQPEEQPAARPEPGTKPAAETRPAATVTLPPVSEAVRKLIEIEEAHEREMRKRKFGVE